MIVFTSNSDCTIMKSEIGIRNNFIHPLRSEFDMPILERAEKLCKTIQNIQLSCDMLTMAVENIIVKAIAREK